MSKIDDYSTKRQLKAIKSHGKRHSSTITGNFLGIFPEPLDIHPKESKKHGKKQKQTVKNMVENMTISIDLDVKDISHNEDFVQKLVSLVGLEKVEKDFEVLSTAERIIHALAKAKFKNVSTIELGGERIYHDPENFFDTDKAINHLIKEIHHKKQPGDRIFIELLSFEHPKCTVDVNLSKIHRLWVHDILIKFHGELPEEYFRRVINYLEQNLEIEDMESKWKNA